MTAVNFSHSVRIDGTEIAGIVLSGATISYGAGSQGQQPEPASAFMELISADAAGNLLTDYPEFTFGDAIPSGFTPDFREKYEGGVTKLKVGAPVDIQATTPTGFSPDFSATYDSGWGSTRFSGFITAIDATPAVVAITAVAPSERLTRVQLDTANWAEESDLDRVQRIALAADVPITREGAASMTVKATGPDSQQASAWQLLTSLAADADALFYANRDGRIIYRTRNATTGSVTVTLEAGATLLDGMQMTCELGRVLNSVEVKYGDPETSVTFSDAASISEYGLRSQSLSIDSPSHADAVAKAHRLVGNAKAPFWHMPSVTVNLQLAKTGGGLYPQNVQELLEADLDDEIWLPYLLPASPVPDYSSRILGYQEVLDPYAWSLTFALNPEGWTAQPVARRATP